MIDIKQKIIEGTDQYVLKNLAQNCEFDLWEKKNSEEQELALDIYSDDETIVELFEMEFDIELRNVLQDLNIIYISFNSWELYNLHNALDEELKEVENEDEKKLLDEERQNLERLYREEEL